MPKPVVFLVVVASVQTRIADLMIHEGIAKAKAEGKYKGRAKTAMAEGR